MKTPAAFLAAILGLLATPGRATAADYTVHEWGTFTSIQGSDGTPLAWNPFESTDLPPFVFERLHATHNAEVYRPNALRFGLLDAKNSGSWLQRMETPVLYFYSAAELAVDVKVRFPKGLLTEWFPQVSSFGPVAGLDALLPATNESHLRWSGVRVRSRQDSAQLSRTEALPSHPIPSHYYPARRTLANLVESTRPFATESAPQRDRLLFYRGAGNFTAPLQVRMPNDQTVHLANVGGEPLGPLFLVQTAGTNTSFVSLGLLAPESELDSPLPQPGSPTDTIPGREPLAGLLRLALVDAGLFAEEADAMVATWTDSWIAEDGIRILYVLPRAWTDRTLPLDLSPAPRDLVRVMVGRADLLSPSMERRTADLARAYLRGAGRAVLPELRQLGLGRFLEPALTRAAAILQHDVLFSSLGCGAVLPDTSPSALDLPELEQTFTPTDWNREIAILKQQLLTRKAAASPKT